MKQVASLTGCSWLRDLQSKVMNLGGGGVINLDMLVLAYLSSKVTLLASVVSVIF